MQVVPAGLGRECGEREGEKSPAGADISAATLVQTRLLQSDRSPGVLSAVEPMDRLIDAMRKAELVAERTYTVAVTFTVLDESDPYLRSEQAVEEAFERWLEGRGVQVHVVNVQPAGGED
jgi:hypothetical protein